MLNNFISIVETENFIAYPDADYVDISIEKLENTKQIEFNAHLYN